MDTRVRDRQGPPPARRGEVGRVGGERAPERWAGGERGQEALIREARRRQRRRRAGMGVAVLAVSSLAAGLSMGLGSGGSSPAARPGPALPDRVAVSTIPLPPGFVPGQVVAGAGKVWLLGDLGAGCGLVEIDPASGRSTRFPLPACGNWMAAGRHDVFVAAGEEDGPNPAHVRLERFDFATGRAVVLAPVVLTTIGTGIYHLGMAAGDGEVWLTSWGATVEQISSTTGVVVRTVAGQPMSGGGHPVMAVGPGGLWVAGGVGPGSALSLLAPGARRLRSVLTGPASSSVLWTAAAGGKVWADVVSYDEHDGRIASTRLVAFDGAGGRVLESPAEQLGEVPPVALDGALWTIGTGTGTGTGSGCRGPERLYRIDPAGGRSAAVATLRTPVEPCLTLRPGQSQMAAAGGDLFVLEPTGSVSPAGVLYRIRPLPRGPTPSTGRLNAPRASPAPRRGPRATGPTR